MSKPRVIFTRPAYWAKCKSEKLDLQHVSISGDEPTKLRNGRACGDSVGGVVTERGRKLLLRAFDERPPDVFLWWAHYANDGSKDKLRTVRTLLGMLRSMAPKAVFLYGNGNQQGMPDFNVSAFMHVMDGILVNTRDEREVRMYKSHGIRHVRTLHTFGFDPGKHGPGNAYSTDKTPKYDCFFGGSQTLDVRTGRPSRFYPKNKMLGGKYPNSKRRFEFLKGVNERFKLLVRGKGRWEPIAAQKYLHADEYPGAFGNAKLALGMYHWDLQRYYTKRTVYSGASGRPLITYYIPGMEKDFEKGVNIEWFKTPDEGYELIKHYLDRNEEREALGARQRAHFVKHHSWEPRLREFERIVEEVLR